MSNFPLVKMMDIDGRQVPVLYAQHETESGESVKTGENDNLPVKDVKVKAELELIKQGIAENKATNELILAKLNAGVDTQITGSKIAKSTDEKPAGKEGDELFLWDTRKFYVHDGTDWRVL